MRGRRRPLAQGDARRLSRAASAVSFSLVDSHDTNRACSCEVGDLSRQRLAALLQYTAFGAPMLYYGDEAGIVAPGRTGFGDPYNRAPYPWDSTDQALIDYYTRARSATARPACAPNGALVTLSTKGNVYAFERVAPPDKPVVVVLNKGAAPAPVNVPGTGLSTG